MPSLPAVQHPQETIDALAGFGGTADGAHDAVITPITNGSVTTFVSFGEVDQAAVQHFMAYFPGIPLMTRVQDGIHAVSVELPLGARVEYKVSTVTGTVHHVAVDPHNPRLATDPFGANSVAYAPGYAEPWWIRPDPAGVTEGSVGAVRRGFVEATSFGHRRMVHWYRPFLPVTGGPLLIIHDGRDFIRHAGILTVLDNLTRVGAIAPAMVALIDPGERLIEYVDDERHAVFLEDIAATAARRFGIDPAPANRTYLGSSMGGVAALSAAWRHGGVGGLALLSGSFVTALGGPQGRGDVFVPVIDFMERFTASPGLPGGRIYMACGTYEGLAADHRAFIPVLEAAGANLFAEESRDGHHWHNWRDRLGNALTHVMPGPNPDRAGNVPT